MNAFFKGTLHCPGCGADTHIHVRAEAHSTMQAQEKNGSPLYVPVEEAQCEHCPETFPIYFYEEGIELVIAPSGSPKK